MLTFNTELSYLISEYNPVQALTIQIVSQLVRECSFFLRFLYIKHLFWRLVSSIKRARRTQTENTSLLSNFPVVQDRSFFYVCESSSRWRQEEHKACQFTCSRSEFAAAGLSLSPATVLLSRRGARPFR